MTSQEAIAIIRATQARLAQARDYGRDGRHDFGPCTECRIYACKTHHKCERKTA